MTSSGTGRKLTQPDMVLLSLYRVARGTTDKVPYEELVLQVWRDYPEAFSLRNHPEHPDASDVHKKLYGSLKSDGLVIALGDKVFRLSDKGIGKAVALQDALKQSASKPVTERARLARDQRNYLDHAIRSRAFEAWSAGQGDKLVDYDARVFFQFSTGTSPKERRLKLNFAQESIDCARQVGMPVADELAQLAAYFVEKFSHLFKDKPA